MSFDGLFRIQVAVADQIDFGPELQIANEFQNSLLSSFFLYQSIGLTSEATDLGVDDIYIVIDEEMALADDTNDLVDKVAQLFASTRHRRHPHQQILSARL